MSEQYRSVSSDAVDDDAIETPTDIEDYGFVKTKFEDIIDDLNDELEEPLIDPVPLKFIKKGRHFTIRVRHGGDSYIDVKINNKLLMDFHESNLDDPMTFY